jgi:hypothetical protein
MSLLLSFVLRAPWSICDHWSRTKAGAAALTRIIGTGAEPALLVAKR